MSTHQPIAIIGAGLSGLMLARILYVHGIESAVYDLDSSPNVRAQGGMLDIHENSGQVALRAGGLFDQFLRIIYPGGDAMRIMDKHAVIHMADDGNRARPEVTRGSLRNLLISALPENAIHWGAKVVNAQTLTDGRHEVSFADGSIVTADLLVGADGAWSKVRSLVTNVTPRLFRDLVCRSTSTKRRCATSRCGSINRTWRVVRTVGRERLYLSP